MGLDRSLSCMVPSLAWQSAVVPETRVDTELARQFTHGRLLRSRAAAEAALGQSQDSLWQANVDRAHSLRTSRQMGQRVEVIGTIEQVEEMLR